MSITPESSDLAVRVRARHRQERPRHRAVALVTGSIATVAVAAAALGALPAAEVRGPDTLGASTALTEFGTVGSQGVVDALGQAAQMHHRDLGTLRITQLTQANDAVSATVASAGASVTAVSLQSEAIAERREQERLEAERREQERIEAERREQARIEAAQREQQRREAEEAAARAQERAATPPPPPASPPPTAGGNRGIAQAMLPSYGWGSDQWSCLDSLWQRESNWNHLAKNPSSGAYGIPQSLPGNKMASVGSDWQTNPTTQIRWGLGYIQGRYGTPCGAWAHSQSVGWY